MTQLERDEYTIMYANKHSWGVHKKLPTEAKRVIEIQDITQNILMNYYSVRNKFNTEKDFKPWIHTIVRNAGITEVANAWREYRHQSSVVDDSIDVINDCNDEYDEQLVIVDYTTPEMLCLAYYDTEQKDVMNNTLICNIAMLCNMFAVEFEPLKYTEGLVKVLDKTHNKMSKAKFNQLPEDIQRMLNAYGDALKTNNLKVTSTGKLRTANITNIIRQLVADGIHDLKQVKLALGKANITSLDANTRTMLYFEKQRAGVITKTAMQKDTEQIAELLNQGITTLDGVIAQLMANGIKLNYNRVREIVGKLQPAL